MKQIISVIFFFICAIGTAQQVFHSPYTQTWPNIFQSQVEEIDRSISIGHSEIVLMTETPAAKEIETLEVLKMDEKAETIVFICQNRQGRPVTFIIPLHSPVEFIDMYRHSKKSGEEEHFRMFVYF